MKKYSKFLIFVVIAAGIIVLNHIYRFDIYFTGEDGRSAIEALVKEHIGLSALLYIIFTIVGCVVLAVPGITFALIAGVAFGPVLGTLLCSLATTFGAMGAFLAGRFFLKDTIEPVARKNKYIRKWLFDESGKNELFVLMITRLVPLFPFNLQNFAYGVTDIRFVTYSLFSFIFMLPGTAMYTVGAAGVADKENRILYIVIAVALAAVVLLMSRFLKSRFVQEADFQSTIEIKETEACNGCGICRENCEFLKKYNLTIGDVQKLSDKAYHCFLCGKCTAVCPKGIDGRNVMLKLRQIKTAENNGKPDTKGVHFLLAEKSDYRYKNDSALTERVLSTGKPVNGNTKDSILFPGCNFSAYYPKTTAYLMDLMKNNGIGTMFDCCGKPIAELGMQQQEQVILNRLTAKLEKANVREVIMVCPNCYYFLKDRIPVKVVSIYEKLMELGISCQTVRAERIFLPCPDRYEKVWFEQIQKYISGKFEQIDDGNCCGLGGCAYITEKRLSNKMAARINENAKGKAYVYCASCAGKIGAAGSSEILHLLPEILGIEEKCDRVHAWRNKKYFAKE